MKEKCVGCGKYVPHRKLVWTADSEGLCLQCCEIKHITASYSTDDELFYPIYETDESFEMAFADMQQVDN
jgi:hypothetical protein